MKMLYCGNCMTLQSQQALCQKCGSYLLIEIVILSHSQPQKPLDKSSENDHN